MKKIVLLAATAIAAFGGTITTGGATNGTALSIVDVTGFTTTGNEMAGLIVTGNFSSGGNVTCLWAAGAGNAGGCTGVNGSNGFALALNGDTFSTDWNLTNITTAIGASLQSLVFNGPAGNTVFDRTNPSSGTPGTSSGNDADGTTSPGGRGGAVNGVATYSNIVNVGANAAVGDLYAQVTIVFGGGGAGLTAGQSAAWVMDTDSIGLRGDVPGSGVPEPSTFALIGGGLLGLAAFRRKRSA